MANIEQLQALVNRFDASLAFYKDTKNAYNEHSCRIEYIDPFLKLLGWDVAERKRQWRLSIEKLLRKHYSTRTEPSRLYNERL